MDDVLDVQSVVDIGAIGALVILVLTVFVITLTLYRLAPFARAWFEKTTATAENIGRTVSDSQAKLVQLTERSLAMHERTTQALESQLQVGRAHGDLLISQEHAINAMAIKADEIHNDTGKIKMDVNEILSQFQEIGNNIGELKRGVEQANAKLDTLQIGISQRATKNDAVATTANEVKITVERILSVMDHLQNNLETIIEKGGKDEAHRRD